MGKKSDRLARSILSALLAEVGPEEFVNALGDLNYERLFARHLDIEAAIPYEVGLLRKWDAAVRSLRDVALDIECASGEDHDDDEESEHPAKAGQGKTCSWEISCFHFRNMIYRATGVLFCLESGADYQLMCSDSNMVLSDDHVLRFRELTEPEFLKQIRAMRRTGKSIAYLVEYLETWCPVEVAYTQPLGIVIKSLPLPKTA